MKNFRFYRRKFYINLIHFFISSKELEEKMENQLGLESTIHLNPKGLEKIASKPLEIKLKSPEYNGLKLVYERSFDGGTSIKYWM